MPASDYDLLDFGGGRKLERFGPYVLDRPCAAAESLSRGRPELWPQATARYERTRGEQGSWQAAGTLPSAWTVRHGELTLELKPTPFGHVGLFPEQAGNWDWISQQVRAANYLGGLHGESGRRCKVLNLFAYTGGSTLAAAAAGAGAEVVHVDAAKNVVAWARRNAELSGLAAAPIRWIAEDTATFVAREVRRGNGYDAVILDPPSYGHGPQGQSWKLERDLPSLLRACLELARGNPKFLLITCHSEGYDAGNVIACLRDNGLHGGAATLSSADLCLTSVDGRTLPAGVMVRASALSPIS